MTLATRTATKVPTVRGDVPSTSLGRTLMHEHTFGLSPDINQNFPEIWGDEEQRVADAIREYRELKTAGIDSVLDVTCLGMGRYIPRIQRIAAEVDVNIIVATGLYIWSAVPLYFAVRGPGATMGGPEYMTDMFVRDIRHGIGDTGVKAAIIKCATHEEGLTHDVTRVLRASAAAHRETGVPITTHTHSAPNGLQQQQVFREEGVDLSRVVIGHVTYSASQNLDYVRELVANGSFVGFDQFRPVAAFDVLARARGFLPGSEDYNMRMRGAEEMQTKVLDAIVKLVKEGHIGHILLSHDHNCFCDQVPPGFFESYDKTYVVKCIVPALRERGISDEQINTMLVDNPRRVFETAALGSY